MIRDGLLFESTDGRSRFLVETGDSVVVGRAPPDEAHGVRAPWSSVSRRHVVITNLGTGGCVVEDAGSASGAFVDGVRVSSVTPIAPGGSLKLTSDAIYTTRAFRGESLAEVLHGGPMPGERVATMTHDILVALAPLHDAGGAHGALTPEEILIGEDGVFVVLARGWTTVDPSGALLGNPAYVSPEMFVSEGKRAANASTDAYALACIAHEALTCARPFPTDTVEANMIAKLGNRTPTIDLSWPAPLRRWLEKVFAYPIEARPKTWDAIAMLRARGETAHPAPVAVAHTELCAELARVAAKWARIREAYAMTSGDDYDWAKGNGRWAVGASHEVAELRVETFPSVGALLDSVDGFLRGRGWDQDHDEPKHARDEMLAALEAVRARAMLHAIE